MTTVAKGACNCEAEPSAAAIGSIPKIAQLDVIRIGRILVGEAVRIASSRGIPRALNWFV